MREHKRMVQISLVLIIIIFFLAIYFYSNSSIKIYYDLVISLFTGLIVLFLGSSVSYTIRKKELLIKLYEESLLIRNVLKDIQLYKDGDLDFKIKGVLHIMEIDYTNLNRTFGDISFFLNKGKGRRIISKLYQYLIEIKILIDQNKNDLKRYDFKIEKYSSVELKEMIEPIYNTFYPLRKGKRNNPEYCNKKHR